MQITYTVQNVGIDLDREMGDAIPVKYTLSGLTRAGHDVRLLTLKGREVMAVDDVESLSGRYSLPLKLSGTRPFQLFESITRRIQRELRLPYFAFFDSYRFYEACTTALVGADLCHEHNGLFSVGTAHACQRLKIPYILTFSADPLLELRLLGKPLRGLHAKIAAWAARYTYNAADKIICVSEPAKKHLVNVWHVPSEKINIMPNGVDVSKFGQDNNPQAIRDEFGLDDNPVILFVGGFQHWHGIDLLVESFAQVLAEVPDARLLLVGDGPARPEIEKKIIALDVSHAVRITGLIPHQRVPQILSIADVATIPYPQLPQELWFSPLKLYEYMASGCAIVASKAGQISDVIEHGQNGILVKPGDVNALAESIVDLLTDAAKRAHLGQNARRQAVSKHSWTQYIERLEAVYRSAV